MTSGYLPPLLRTVQGLGYAAFNGPTDFDLNIIGVRNRVSMRDPNHYSDDLHVIWKQSGIWRAFHCALTTTPGTWYLQHPMRPAEGCAVLAPQQARGAYRLGLHKGKRALVQIGAKVKFYRDNDLNTSIDIDESTLQESFSGLNIHSGSRHARSDTGTEGDGSVGRWSAGCQTAHPSDVAFLVELADKQAANGPGWDRFTYTLITEDQL